MAQTMAVIRLFFVFYLFDSSLCHEPFINVTEWKIVPYSGEAGDVYFFIGFFKKLDWMGALKFCRTRDMELAAIMTAEENDELEKAINKLGDNTGWHISGTDFPRKEPRTFYWLSNGRRLTYNNWATGEPQDKKTHKCVGIKLYDTTKLKWYSIDCKESTYFICEIREKICFIYEDNY